MKILLNKSKGKYSRNEEGTMNVVLSSNTRITPYSAMDNVVDIDDIYYHERNNSNLYRLILTINPICTNVLYNMRTEIIKNEGSINPTVLIGDKTIDPESIGAINSTVVDYKQAIRDTEYSNPNIGGFEYHCGVDIFNNHMLRANNFVHINTIVKQTLNPNDNKKCREVFNTIADYNRTDNGEIAQEYAYSTDVSDKNAKQIQTHVYNTDNIDSMISSYSSKVFDKDGWIGFINPTNIEIPVYKDDREFYVNKLINSKDGCSFIDMYPDRKLFSFIPNINQYRRRLEYNWDYILMYPFANDYKKFNDINENNVGAMKIIEATVTHTNSGFELLSLRSLFKHNLKSGDYIRLYYIKDNGDIIKYHKKVKVYRTGTSNGMYNKTLFNLKMVDITSIYKLIGVNEKENIKSIKFFFKKEINNIECEYYVRKFKEVTNINGERLKSEINKLAYGENIYGDRLSQIIFSEKIDLEGLTNNLGMPLNTLYLTIIKRNAGRIEWYTNNDFGNDNVEYSHCFGKVTSGFDIPFYYDKYNHAVSQKNYNVRRLHNINLSEIIKNKDYKKATENIYSNFAVQPEALEGMDDKGIIIKPDIMELYGDIVEFDCGGFIESILEDVYYRFNTEQRETSNPYYYDIFVDGIESDDNDLNGEKLNGFNIKTEFLNKDNDGNKFAGNIQPEGYIYKAHNKIKIKEIDDTLKSANGYLINYDSINIDMSEVTIENEFNEKVTYNEISIISPIDYGFEKGQIIAFYDYKNKQYIWGTLTFFDKTLIKIMVDNKSIDINKLRNKDYIIVLCKDGCPRYARYNQLLKSFIWRDNINMCDLPTTNELYDTPFTNGCHYIHKNINFFLQRQDPVGDYYMSKPENDYDEKTNTYNTMRNYRRMGWSNIDFSGAKYIENEIDNSCY